MHHCMSRYGLPHYIGLLEQPKKERQGVNDALSESGLIKGGYRVRSTPCSNEPSPQLGYFMQTFFAGMA